jgi:hypothetical protein
MWECPSCYHTGVDISMIKYDLGKDVQISSINHETRYVEKEFRWG